MDKIEVFNRAKGEWEDAGQLVSGWEENFVIDKTTDSGKVKLKYKGKEFPDWKNGDWCRFIHTTGDEQGATYTEKIYSYQMGSTAEHITVHHEQQAVSVIGSPSEVYVWVETDLAFDEPINVDVYILGSWGITDNEKKEANVTLTIPIGETSSSRYTFVMPVDLSGYLVSVTENITSVSPAKALVKGGEENKVYLPKNHEQYIIKNPSMVKDFVNEEIDIQLELAEPIEWFMGVLCETRSFKNQGEKNVDGNLYLHDRLNYLTVLENILKTTPANNDISKSWFSRIKILNQRVLSQVAFNDQTYSEPSLYEILLNKFDSAIGRTPVVYFDMDAETDLPRTLSRDEYLLNFERQDGFDRDAVQLSQLCEKVGQIVKSQSFENYAKNLVVNYDNLASNIKGECLTNVAYAMPEIDTNERNITGYTEQDGSWVIKMPHKIKSVTRLVRYYVRNRGYHVEPTVYIRDYADGEILTEPQYVASETYYGSTQAAWYVEGENKIHVNEVKYTNTNVQNGELFVYYVEYEAFIDGRIEVGEDGYSVQVNQIDAQISSDKFGKYLKDYLASMNKADITISKTVESFADVVREGTRVLDDDKVYLITKVSVKNRGLDYEVVYQLNQNHTRRNDNISAPQEIRKNIEIGVDATKERKSCYVDNYTLSLDETEASGGKFAKSLVFSAILNNFSATKYPNIAKLTFKSKLYKISNGVVAEEDFSKELACELVKFYSGDAFWFNMRYYDNAEAGKTKTINSFVYTDIWGRHYVYGMPYQQVPVLYTDPFGEAEKLDISIYYASSADLVNIDVSTDDELNANVVPVIQKSALFPLPNIINSAVTANQLAGINDINYYKQSPETFNYTYGARVNTSSNIILCTNFFKKSNLLFTSDHAGKYIEDEPRFVEVRAYSTNMNETDFVNAVSTGSAEVSSISTSANMDSNDASAELSNGEITINLASQLAPSKCIAFIDETGLPLLIINDYDKYVQSSYQSIKLYC